MAGKFSSASAYDCFIAFALDALALYLDTLHSIKIYSFLSWPLSNDFHTAR